MKNGRSRAWQWSKSYWKQLLALLVVLLAFVFFRDQRHELGQVWPVLKQANSLWLWAGMAVTCLVIGAQCGIYMQCFRAIGEKISWSIALELFLKRNLLSVFLPAGGVSALAYQPSRLKKKGLPRMAVPQASSLYAFAGMLSIVLVGIPVLGLWSVQHPQLAAARYGLLLLALIIVLAWQILRSIQRQGKIWQQLHRYFPVIALKAKSIFEKTVQTKSMLGAAGFSVLVEGTGILHLYIAMMAVTGHASLLLAAGGYMISIVLMAISPFLRGLGAIEITLAYFLQASGFPLIEAVSVVVLYRIFEFWLPLLAGVVAFAWKGKELFVRLLPAVSIFLLGLVNIISVVTPPISARIHLLEHFLPVQVLHISAIFTLFLGLGLMLVSAWLIKGFKIAWWAAVALSFFSMLTNLIKGLDYEEAMLAGIILGLLFYSRSQYRIRTNLKWARLGLISLLFGFLAVCLFSFISFYFIDRRHFGVDFTWRQAFEHTARIFLLSNDSDLHPVTRFGHEFVWIIRGLGMLTWSFALFTFSKPYFSNEKDESDQQRASHLLELYGNSCMDYFKIADDKLFYFSEDQQGFLAYRLANGFALVLEEPVCPEENKLALLLEFSNSCRKMGLKPAYYRVDEDAIGLFEQLDMRHLFIGQEALLELDRFSLEGKDRKSLRNGLNSLIKKGYTTTICSPPYTDAFLLELREVSNEWLESFDKKEMVFSQGKFDLEELQKQDTIVVKDEKGLTIAFLNIIPDYQPGECTYDLIRKRKEAPGGCMDALIVKLVDYARQRQYRSLNLGLVPLTGNDHPQNPAEQLIKFISEKWRPYYHYQTLRAFKEKYASHWADKYLIYEHDFDLIQLPVALQKAMKA